MAAPKVDGITLNTLRLRGIGDHVDVDLTGLADNELLVFDLASGNWQPEASAPPGPHALTSHSDVIITTPTVGDVIRFNSVDWVNVASDEVPAHAASHMLGGSDPVTSFDNLTAELNLGGNNITNIATVKLTGGLVGKISTSGTLTVSGGSSAILGGNILLRGEAATDANDIDLRSGTTVRLRWDNSVPEWNFQGLNIANVGTITATTFSGTLSGAAPAGSLSGTTLAANVVSSSLTSVGTLATLTVTATITGSVSGNAATATNVAGTGLTGTVLASNIVTSSLTSVGVLGATTFSGLITAQANIARGIATGGIVLSGGTSAVLGGNILVRGETGSPANDIELRQAAVVKLRWDSSVPQWDFQGLNVGGIGTLTGTTLIGAAAGSLSGTTLASNVVSSSLTTLGTLSILNVDNIRLDVNTISTVAGVDLLITPLAGQQLILDGTIVIDAGVLTGGTSFTVTTFVGALTGNADTATNVAGTGLTGTVLASNIVTSSLTSVGSLTSLTVGGITSTSTNMLVRNVANSQAAISGGSTVALGANIVLHGETEIGTALDIDFRASAVIKLKWDNSVPEWNFQGLNVNNIGTLTATNLAGTITTAAQTNITTVGTLAILTVTATMIGSVSGSAGNAPAGTLTGTVLASNVVTSSLTSVGTLATLTVTATIAGSVSGASGNSPAGTLTGATLASNVVFSSLTTFGNLTGLTTDVLRISSESGIHRTITSGALFISGGSSIVLGANIVLHGEADVPVLDMLFRTGTTIRLQWDNAVPEWNFQGLNVNNIGTLTATTLTVTGTSTLSRIIISGTQGIVRSVATDALVLSGGTTVALGANIVLRGQTGSPANDIELRQAGVVKLRWDASAANWDFQGLSISGVANLAGTLTTVAQGNVTSVGTLTGLTVTATITGSITGNAATATNVAGTGLTGTTLASGIVTSSLTSLGTITTLTVGAGSSTVPSIRFSGNLTTGLSAPAGSQLLLLAGATTVIKIQTQFVDVETQLGSVQHNIGNSGTAFTFNADNGNSQTVDNNGTATVTIAATTRGGFVYCLKVTAKSGAGSGWNWPAQVKWTGGAKPVMTTTLGRRDIITLFRDSLDAEIIGVFSLNHF